MTCTPMHRDAAHPQHPEQPTPQGAYAQDLALALRLADLVDPLTYGHFLAQDVAVESKPDTTPVTEADREAERVVRGVLAQERPQDSVLGEEYGVSAGAPAGTVASPRRQWVVDPIDGTKNFVRGVPVWATLIGLIEDGEVVLGVVSAPALGRRWWASRGCGAWSMTTPVGGSQAQGTCSEPRRLSVSSVSSLADASLSYSSLSGWKERGLREQLLAVMDECWRTRAYGDFWSYMMVAEGCVDVAAEPELELYDMCALVPIVTEAGGRFTSLAGEPGPWGGNAIASNGLLHEQVCSRLVGN